MLYEIVNGVWLEYRQFCVAIFLLQLVAKWLDGAPTLDEPTDRGRCGEYSNSYVTDANREVRFSIPPASQDLDGINKQVGLCTGVFFNIIGFLFSLYKIHIQ